MDKIDFDNIGINKDFILSKVTESDIFKHYLNNEIQLGKLIKSPFRRDSDPSFNIIKSSYTGGLLFKDFGDGSYGNCFELVKKIYNCDYDDAIKYIAKDLRLQDIKIEKPNKSTFVEDIQKYEKKIIPVKRQFKKIDFDYFNQFYIPLNYLVHDRCYAANYVYLNKCPNDTSLFAEHRDDNPIYVYEVNDKHKVYKPLNPTKKGKWLSTTTMWDIQGMQYIDEVGDILFITSSMKDRWVLKLFGYNAIAPGGEGQIIPEPIMNYCFARYKKIIIFYDNDEAGINGALKFQQKYPEVDIIYIPTDYEEKDISDFIKKYGKKETEILLDSLI